MGKIRKQIYNLPLKKAFHYLVIVMVFVVLMMSALSIFGCWYAQKILLPESGHAYLFIEITYMDGSTENLWQRIEYDTQTPFVKLEADGQEKKEVQDTNYTIEQIKNSIDELSSKKKAVYYILGSLMVILPLLYSIIGVSLCAWYFYQKKMEQPLKVLSAAAENIQNYNLDFTISYDSKDEMGELVSAFEQMRMALYKNNIELWKMIRDEKELQASLAHDLRNPIAVLKGYAEYLQQCIQNGNLSEEKVGDVSENMIAASVRMERYTDSIKQLNNIEEIRICKENVRLLDFLHDISEDFEVVAAKHQKNVYTSIPDVDTEIAVDRWAFSRIMENVFMNALRFAVSKIEIKYVLCNPDLVVSATDDGKGFSDDILHEMEMQLAASMRRSLHDKLKIDLFSEHMGLGLVISRILAEKHGGSIKIENLPDGGAKVSITINIEKITQS